MSNPLPELTHRDEAVAVGIYGVEDDGGVLALLLA